MIQTVTFRVRSDEEEKIAELTSRVARMVRARKDMLGADVVREGSTVILRMRMSHLDRWRISEKTRTIATFMFTTCGFQFSRPLVPELVVTELTRNKLRDGEGRTPRVRPNRVVTDSDLRA